MKFNMGKPVKITNLTEVEKSWLASAIDGEGSIYELNPRGYKQFYLSMCNTNKDYVKYVASLLGVKVKSRLYGSKKKTVYEVLLGGKIGVLVVLYQIFPYLIIKRSKALIAIRFIENNLPKERIDNLHLTPEWWKKHKKDLRDRNKKMWADPKWRRKFSKLASEGMKKYWKGKKKEVMI